MVGYSLNDYDGKRMILFDGMYEALYSTALLVAVKVFVCGLLYVLAVDGVLYPIYERYVWSVCSISVLTCKIWYCTLALIGTIMVLNFHKCLVEDVRRK